VHAIANWYATVLDASIITLVRIVYKLRVGVGVFEIINALRTRTSARVLRQQTDE